MLRSAIAALTAIALATPTLALGAASTLYTTQAQYCAQPSDIYVNAFSAVYHKSNQSIVFYLALDTSNSNVDVTARVQVNAYNDTLISQEIDLCQLLGGVLCPLPSLNISTYGTYQFPDDLANSIPSLAWTVPDLEAYARLELVQTDGSDALCIEAPLSNGLTAGHAAVGYATGIFTGLAVIIGLIHSACNTASPAQYRWFDILYLYQFSASLGMLNLDYPTVWRAVSKQFFWSFSLFHSEQMQSSINSMRYKTGGYLNPSIVDSALFIPGPSDYSRYSSLNTIINRLRLIASALSGGDLFGGLFKREMSQYAGTGVKEMIKRDIIPEGESAITSSVIANYDDLVQRAGLAVYTTSINIPYPNALTTIFFFFLAWIGIFLVVHLVIYLVTLAMARGTHFGAIDFKRRFYLWMNGNALFFICIMWLYPLWIFGFFQFRIRDSKLAIFWAVMGIVLTFIPLLVVFILSIFRHRRYSSTSPGVSPLYTSYKWFHSAGAVYRQYRPRMNWFWMVLVLAMIARAGFVAFGPRNGWAQVIGIMVVEVIVLVLLLALRPHKDKKGDWLAPVLSFLRLAMAGLCIAFLPSVNVAGIPRTVIGFVLIAIVGITSIILFLGLIFNLFYGWLFRRHSDRIEDGLEVERSTNWVGSSSRETKRPMTQVASTRSPVDSVRTSADLLGNAQGRNRNSIIEPVGDNSYSYPEQGQGQAGYASGYGAGNDHDAYARNGNGNGNGNFGMGPTLAPPVDHRTSMLGGGSRSRTPSYRRSQYGGSVRNSGAMTPTYNGNNQYSARQYA